MKRWISVVRVLVLAGCSGGPERYDAPTNGSRSHHDERRLV